jgi:uncharacterized spore protein YtfJ
MAITETPSNLTSIVDSLRDRAGVETVFGDPIEREDRTVVPVARVTYGFGGGWGSGGEDLEADLEDLEVTEDDEEVDADAFGEGGGFGGGLSAQPIGALVITDDGTKFVRLSDRRRAVGALLIGLVVGLLLGRRGGTNEPEEE